MNHKLLCPLTLTTALLPSALRAGEGSPWTFGISLYGPAVGMFGDVLVKGNPAEGDCGLGSNLTWHALPYSDWRFTKSGLVQIGYRWRYMHYETGSGTSQFNYDMLN